MGIRLFWSVFTHICEIPLPNLQHFKGSVQRKLRWVENGVDPRVQALDHGAGHYFLVLVRLHLVLTILYFRFRSVLPNLWTNRRSATSGVAPTYRNVIGATLLPALKGEAGHLRNANRIRSANSKFSRIFSRCSSPTGGVRIAAPVVLAQH
jgi:hypothetical protein